MSGYDFLDVEGCEGAQVKCWWCDMRKLRKGDEVPPVGGQRTYAVALREGGYLVVRGGRLAEWQAEPPDVPIFDKWGSSFGADSLGVLSEGYFFSKRSQPEDES